MWPSFYFSSRHHPSIHPFSQSFHFFIRISVFQIVVFALLGLVWSIYPTILVVCLSPNPYPHLSCDHICTSPVGAIHLSIHFHHLCTFPSVFHFLNVCFYTSPVGVIHISTHSFCLYTSLSIFLSFMCPYLYFSSRRYPSIHPYSSLVYFSTHILVFQMVIFVLPPSV